MRPVGKSQLAQIAGVSPAAITKAIRAGRLTVLDDGKIDQDAADTVEYLSAALERKRRDRATATGTPKSRTPGGGRPALVKEDDFILERRLKIEDKKQVILKRKLDNAQKIGTVVLREDVERGIIGPIETTFVRLLTDLSKSLSGQIVPMVKGGATEEEIEVYIRGEHSALLKSLKKAMAKALNNGNTASQ